MAGSINKVDYDVLTTAVSTYSAQAGAIDEVMTALQSMNEQLQEGWTNQTSDAFIAKYESEYKVSLTSIRDALNDISQFIQNYMNARQDEDSTTAGGL